MYRLRKTTEGLAVLIRKTGKSAGIEMLPEDSWHGYVMRLATLGDKDKLQELADYLRGYFYSGKAAVLSREQYHAFVAALRSVKKVEKETAEA